LIATTKLERLISIISAALVIAQNASIRGRTTLKTG